MAALLILMALAIVQITIIDLVFSLDSIITANILAKRNRRKGTRVITTHRQEL